MAVSITSSVTADMLSRLMKLRSAEVFLTSRRIATGFRLNGAGDDPAGMGIIQGMEAQIRGLNQAARNIQQGLSLVQNADSGTEQIQNLITEIRTLVVQAGNGTLTSTDLNNIQTQIDQLLASIDEIANNTSFNGLALLNGTTSVGVGAKTVSFTDIRIDGASATTNTTNGTYNVNVTALPKRGTLVGSDISNVGKTGQITVTNGATGQSATISYSGTASQIANQLNASLSAIGITATFVDNNGTYTVDDGTVYSPASGQRKIVLQTDAYGAGSITTSGLSGDNIGFAAPTATIAGANIAGNLGGNAANGSGLTLTGTAGATNELAVTVKGAAHGSALGWTAPATLGPVTVSGATTGAGSQFKVQYGANPGQYETIETFNMTASYLGLTAIDVTTSSGRSSALTALDAAAGQVQFTRAKYSAYTSELNALLSNDQTAATNLASAQSRIKDADIAAETTKLAMLQILQNTTSALLAQANVSSSQVYNLLVIGQGSRR